MTRFAISFVLISSLIDRLPECCPCSREILRGVEFFVLNLKNDLRWTFSWLNRPIDCSKSSLVLCKLSIMTRLFEVFLKFLQYTLTTIHVQCFIVEYTITHLTARHSALVTRNGWGWVGWLARQMIWLSPSVPMIHDDINRQIECSSVANKYTCLPKTRDCS